MRYRHCCCIIIIPACTPRGRSLFCYSEKDQNVIWPFWETETAKRELSYEQHKSSTQSSDKTSTNYQQLLACLKDHWWPQIREEPPASEKYSPKECKGLGETGYNKEAHVNLFWELPEILIMCDKQRKCSYSYTILTCPHLYL